MSVHISWDDDMVVITLDRPQRRNAVDHATLVALREVQHEAERRQVRAVVLTGTPPAFCAGADLHGVENDVFTTALSEVLQGFTALDAVTIAAIDGPALGAGTQLAVACDLRVATPGSVFGIPAAKLGLAVDAWTVQRLGCEFGWSTARAMLLAAATRTADHLHDTGGVHRLGDLDTALAWAATSSPWRRSPFEPINEPWNMRFRLVPPMPMPRPLAMVPGPAMTPTKVDERSSKSARLAFRVAEPSPTAAESQTRR
jgi:enoyl-CoA hydratase